MAEETPPMIWLVDDSRTEAQMTRASLGSGYEFEYFEDGSLVVERVAAGAKLPDVVLLDWVMPGMPGPQVCRFMREHEATRDLPVILVTASRIETADVVEGLATGATDYVARPFAPEELRARVESAIRTYRSTRAANLERERLTLLNKLSHALFEAGTDIPRILSELARALVDHACDGCSLLLLPGELPQVFESQHRGEPSGAALAEISTVADPIVHAFEDASEARANMPPAYHGYIDRFGLRGLAILPFPILSPVQGVVTLTRDGVSQPFSAEDMSLIETCIEYAALAVQNAMRYEAERTTRYQLDTILEHLPVGIVASDGAEQITMTNAAVRALIPGIDRAERMTDVPAIARFSSPDGTAIDAWQNASELVIGPDRRFASIATVPLASTRTGTRSVTMIQDVTLERAVAAEREQVSRFMQQLLGIVGHDLRNPLGAFVAGLDMLRMTASSGRPITPVLDRMSSSVRRMSRIVDQLLDVTRASLGAGIEIQPATVELKPLIESVVEEVKTIHPAASLTLKCADRIVGQWDPDRLAQVVSNIASNAAHYGKPGAPIVIDVGTEGDQARIGIHNANRDRPISPNVLAPLFDPHRRGTEGHRNSSGLGLGLYIVKQIVEAHRGTVHATSDETGTSFTVLLPVDQVADRALAR